MECYNIYIMNGYATMVQSQLSITQRVVRARLEMTMMWLPLKEIISTVNLDHLSSQNSNVDADNEDVGGYCELSPSVDVSDYDDIYLESVSISKLEYARFHASLYDDPEISRPLYPGSNLTLLQALVQYMVH